MVLQREPKWQKPITVYPIMPPVAIPTASNPAPAADKYHPAVAEALAKNKAAQEAKIAVRELCSSNFCILLI